MVIYLRVFHPTMPELCNYSPMR